MGLKKAFADKVIKAIDRTVQPRIDDTLMNGTSDKTTIAGLVDVAVDGVRQKLRKFGS